MSNELGFKTLDDFEWKGKTVLVRVDLNCPVEKGVVQDSPRVAAHAKTIRELALKGARVVVLAHQGRPGDEDFLPLEQHAALLEKHCRKKVKFVPDVTGLEVEKRVKKMVDGKIVLLDNLRFSSEEMLEKTPEEHSKSTLVRKLAPLAQAFVNDAYSVSHRSHCSVVGFTPVLPSFAGRVMEAEVRENSKAAERAEHPNVYVLGGAKPDDCVKLLRHAATSAAVDKILVGGVIGELCLIAKGVDVGEKKAFIESKSWAKSLPEVKAAVEKGGAKIILPIDLAWEKNGQRFEAEAGKPVAGLAMDVGSKTAKAFAAEVKAAKSVYVKGPMGQFEREPLSLGTKEVFSAVVKSKAFSLVGGGHTLEAFEKLGLSTKRIGHVSLSGGALLSYLCGEKLPGVEALRTAAKS